MDTATSASEVEAPVKQVEEAAEPTAEPVLPNGVHTHSDATPETEEPIGEEQPESSEQTAVDVPEADSKPEHDEVESAEQQNGAQPAAEAEAEVEPDAEPTQETEPVSAPAAAVPREELPIWRKRYSCVSTCIISARIEAPCLQQL